MSIDVAAYQPGTPVDDELATVAYAAVARWADQRPITAELVASRLRTHADAPATLLATGRAHDGRLVGAAALRWPAAPGATGRLWGPAVLPESRRRGLGARLLAALDARLADTAAAQVTSAEVPVGRCAAHRLFHAAGWTLAPASVLLKAQPLPPPNTPPQPSRVRPAQPDQAGDLAGPLGRLYGATHPTQPPLVAAATWQRWTADSRYRPDCLLVAPSGDGGELDGAALVYPLAHTDPAEPPEALLADVLVAPNAGDPQRLRDGLIAAALSAGRRHGAAVARALVPAAPNPTLDALRRAGLQPVTTLATYAAPQRRPAPAASDRSAW